MKLLERIKAWWKDVSETFRFAMNLDVRVLDDPAWLTGQKPREETQQMVANAKKRADLL